MSFRLKTILGIALIEAALLSVLLLAGFNLIHDLGAREIETRAQTTAELAAAMTRNAILATDIASLQAFADIVAKSPGVTYSRILVNDRVAASAGDADKLRLPFHPDQQFDDATDNVFDIASVVAVDGIKYGEVQLGISISAVNEMIELAHRNGTLIALVEMALVAGFSFLLGFFLTRQLNELQTGARRVAGGDFAHTLPIRGKDELARTAESFNTMTSQVRATLSALEDSKSRHKAILDTAADGIITIDSKGLIESVNPAAERIFGYPAEELHGRNVNVLMPEPYSSAHDGYLKTHLETGRKTIIGIGREVVGRRKDGTIFPMDLAIGKMHIGEAVFFNGIVRDISERKMAERLHRDALSLQSAILASAGYAIIATDPHGLIVTFNPAAERLLGYRAKEMIGRETPMRFHDPDEVDARASELSVEFGRTVGGFQAVVAKSGQGATEEREWTFVNDEGSRIPVQLSVSALHDEAGEITGYLCIAMDLRERRQAESERVENEARKGAILDSALDCIISMDHQGRVTEFNPAAERTFGYRREQAIGQELAALIIPEPLRDAHRHGMARFLANGHGPVLGKRIEVTALRADRTEFPCELAISVIQLGETPHFTAYIRDISQRVAAEQKLRRFTTELNAIFTLSPDGFVAFDADGRLSYANPAFRLMLETDQLELKDLEMAEFDRMLAGMCDDPRRYQDTAERADNDHDVLQFVRPRPQIVQRNVRTLVTDAGETLGRVLYFRDITHETEVDRMKSEFLSTAAHELRTPMASIHGFSELLIHRDFDAATRKDLLETIHRQSSALVHMVNELLDLARIEARAGKDFHIGSQDLLSIVRDTVAAFKPPSDRHRLAVALPSALPPGLVDREKFAQAFLNVLSNACKYSPQGGEIRIEADQRQHDGAVQVGVRVSDEGIGMTREQLSHIFERFYRADTSGAIPGTGLGMSLVKEILDILKGEVEIESEAGRGTQVCLWVPAAAPAHAQEAKA